MCSCNNRLSDNHLSGLADSNFQIDFKMGIIGAIGGAAVAYAMGEKGINFEYAAIGFAVMGLVYPNVFN